MNLVKNILSYLNKSASAKQLEDFNQWLGESADNKKIVDEYASIWSESDHISSYKQFDIDHEWELFNKGLNSAKAEPAAQFNPKPEKKSFGRIFLKRVIELGIAAVLAGIVFYFVRPKPPVEVPPKWYIAQTQDFKDTIQMVDGSSILLAENSAIIYPASLEDKNKRTVYLKGNATFDIVSIDTLPFGVESYEVGIDVLGTVFKMAGKRNSAEVENLEGKVKFFELENPENFIELNPGDKIKYEGGAFKDLREIPGKDYKIGFVFEHLLDRYYSRISSGAGLRSQYQAGGNVRVDLTQGLEGILLQLDSTAIFNANPTSRCRSCYEITQFKALPPKE